MAIASPLDRFRAVLAGATRAIAEDAEAEVVFASDASGQSHGKVARVVSPGPGLEPRLVAEARGAADALALRLKHHDPRLHATRAPVGEDARAVFDALEQARVEALGAKAMDGIRGNLRDLAEARVRADAITRARSAVEVPLATAIGLIARQRLSGEAPPKAAEPGLRLVSDWIEEKAGAELDALALTIDDQAAYATLSRRLLEDLDLAADEPSDQAPEEAGEDEEGDDSGPDEADDAESEGESGGDVEMRSEETEQEEGEDESADSEADVEEGESTTSQEGADQARANALRRNWAEEPITDYRPYTTRFDETVEAEELCDEEELGRLRAYLDQQMTSLGGV
ncbi:MAG TPA: cobaltochelatase subunit CobT, partial [Sphingomicrobium sp.]|nr:cobaltochelatase subunit CobT [Sphingomicrobium sp.]